MIDVKELMIGNLVNQGETVLIVESIYNEGVESGELVYAIENVNAVPLTEGWLLRFGFQLNNTTVTTSTWTPNDVYTEKIYERHPLHFYITWEVEPNRFKSNRIILNYIHQLQNLYFALCGQELTLTETLTPNNIT